MKRELIISGAIANAGGEVSTEDLLSFLKSRTNAVEYYRLAPPPDSIMGAAFDWQAILGVTASSLAIGQALWAAYMKFIWPKKEKRKEVFLFVAVKTENKEFVQFTIGRDHENQEVFVREFCEKVERLRISTPNAEVETEKREIRVSEIWKKV